MGQIKSSVQHHIGVRVILGRYLKGACHDDEQLYIWRLLTGQPMLGMEELNRMIKKANSALLYDVC